jgi:hypothetical protein
MGDAGPAQDGGADSGTDAGSPDRLVRRINVQGPVHEGIDYQGLWAADPGGSLGVCGPNAFHLPPTTEIHGTEDDPLFRGEVWGDPVSCVVGGGDLPVGRYEVRLYFAEIYFGEGCAGSGGTGTRVFDVVLEGATVETDIDLYEQAGCAASVTESTGHPVVKTYRVRIVDGTLDIRLPASANNGKISAIEVLQL